MNRSPVDEQSRNVRLHLQGDQLSFIVSMVNESDTRIQGSLSAIRNILNKDKLTGASLENAINHTEDLIMPMLSALPKQEMLAVDGPEFERIVNHLTLGTDDSHVSIDTVENLYRRLADYAQGSALAWREEISPEQIALGLVVLRELMHHGGFRLVTLVT